MANFMQRQVTGLENWLQVETTCGTEFIRESDVRLFVRNSDCHSQPLTDDEREETIDKIRDYVEGTPQSWENVKGYGARLSAPGYLDCTEWAVFDTAEEAKEHLDEMYPEEEDDKETTYEWRDGTNGKLPLRMTMEQAQSVSHSGQCDDDVKALRKVPEIWKQLDAMPADDVREFLKEYGAWGPEELADHDVNLDRVLWLAGSDIKEHPEDYREQDDSEGED